jgi:pimeloyl-ACP methyl ester carboxylesterase
MASLSITTAPHLTFDALVAGEPEAPLVLLLHGFAESMHCWRAQLTALSDKGYRAIAPSQRGYSPTARPDPRDAANYHIDRLMDDAMAIVEASGYADARFHLVGHDWGGSIAWALADRYPPRIASLTVLSRPHPMSFRRALAKPDGDQKHRSRHHGKFLDADTGRLLIEDNARRLREGLFGQDVSRGAIEDHVAILGNAAAIEAALAWYRSNKGLSGDFGTIQVPTLYIWGDKDATVGPDAAHGTGEFVGAAYAMEVLPGVGHFVMDQAAARATELIVAHMKKHPV